MGVIKKYEYKIIVSYHLNSEASIKCAEKEFNELGKLGWSLIGLSSAEKGSPKAVFKREITNPSTNK